MGRPTNTDERQLQIARAMIDVMAERGYDRASIARIAEGAGLAGGLVHYHFKNKRAILLRAAELMMEDHLTSLDRFLEGVESAPDELDALLRFHMGIEEADPKRMSAWLVICSEALRDEAVKAVFRDTLKAIADRLTKAVERGVAEGTLRTQSTKQEVSSVLALIEGYFLVGTIAPEVVPKGAALLQARHLAASLFSPQSA